LAVDPGPEFNLRRRALSLKLLALGLLLSSILIIFDRYFGKETPDSKNRLIK
jgi:hypothetical protein